MARIGNLDVGIRARTEKFGAARRKVKGLRRSLLRLKSVVPGMNLLFSRMGGILSGLALGGFAAYVKSTIASLDVTGKFSERIGISMKALTRLQFAAGRTGAEMNTLHKGLQRMVSGIGEAVQGSGEAAGALRQLGLDARQLANLRPEQQFDAIADAMQGVRTQTERVQIAVDLFGQRGAALINTLSEGSAGLRRFAIESDRLGNTLDDGMRAEIAAANDAIGDMSTAINGALRQAVVALAPLITSAANSFTEWAADGQNLKNTMLDAFESIAKGAAQLAKSINVVFGFFDVFSKGIQSDRAALDRAVGKFISAWDADPIKEVEKAFNDFRNGVRETASEVQSLDGDIQRLGATEVVGGSRRPAPVFDAVVDISLPEIDTSSIARHAQETGFEWMQSVEPILSSGLTDLIVNGIQNGFKDGADIAQQVMGSLLRTLIQQIISSGILQLVKMIGGLGSGGTSTGGGGVIGSFTSLLPAAGSFASVLDAPAAIADVPISVIPDVVAGGGGAVGGCADGT